MTTTFDRACERLVAGFRATGVERGDVLLVHSDTDELDAFLPGADMLDRFGLLETALRAVVGAEGTVLVPTFTYSFCTGRRFDPAKRNSAVGMFTNYLRRRADAHRSHHPVFSFAAIGKDARAITADVSKFGFGKGSVFDRLMARNGKISCFDIAFQKCCTFVHYIEELHGTSYRYHKTFRGEIVVDGEAAQTEAVNYVRDLERNVESDFDAFARRLTQAGILRRAALDPGFILTYPCRETFAEGVAALDENPFVFLAHPPAES